MLLKVFEHIFSTQLVFFFFSDANQLSSGVVSSTQDDCIKRPHEDADNEAVEDDVSKRKKRKDNEEKEPMGKPAPVARGGPGR